MSGPFIFGTELNSIPTPIPYVSAEPERIERWKAPIQTAAGESFKVGVAWQGNPHHQLDRFCSVQLELFEDLSMVPHVRLFSLQRGPGTEQLARWLKPLNLVELTRRDVSSREDWADTAAIVANMH